MVGLVVDYYSWVVLGCRNPAFCHFDSDGVEVWSEVHNFLLGEQNIELQEQSCFARVVDNVIRSICNETRLELCRRIVTPRANVCLTQLAAQVAQKSSAIHWNPLRVKQTSIGACIRFRYSARSFGSLLAVDKYCGEVLGC